jgi:hypothetical protein
MSDSINRPERDDAAPRNDMTGQSPDSPRTAAVLSPTSARQGVMTGRVRWILGISLGLAVIAMALVAWA